MELSHDRCLELATENQPVCWKVSDKSSLHNCPTLDSFVINFISQTNVALQHFAD